MGIVFTIFLLASQAASGAVISGSVVRSGSVESVAGAQILLTRIDGRLTDSITAIAGGNGNFTIRNIPPGTYRLFSDHAGYTRSEYRQHRMGRPGLSFTLTAGQQMTGATLTMIPTGVITGRIIDGNSAPLPRVYVR